MTSHTTKIFMVMALLGLGACQSPTAQVRPLTAAPAQIKMAVAGLDVVVEDVSGEDGSGAWVDVPMTRQVEQWFKSRYQPTLGQERGTLSIRKASLKEIPLAQEAGVKKLFSNGEKERYEAVIDVRFEVRDATGFAEKFASASVRHSAPAAGGISLAERQSLVQKLINDAITDADRELVRSLESFLPLMIVK